MKKKQVESIFPNVGILFLLLIALTFASCFSTKRVIVKFNSKPDEIYTKSSLDNLLKNNPNPSIVVRVPKSNTVISDNKNLSLSSTYSSIEKELIKNNFIVRDEAVFEKVANQNQQMDYAKLHELTGVDILLELVDVTSVEFSTNIYYDKNGKPFTLPTGTTLRGRKADFKIVILKENEVAGNYTFYWTPCLDGCEYIYQYGPSGSTIIAPNYVKRLNVNEPLTPYETISSDAWSNFISEATRRIINEMK
ncbi:MAG: hypothetical protein LBN74_07705 [Prevotella sp.]|jgi:biopolymer transport protein ExbD|nr:hypothetical protein [Prevotella sp.]